MKFKSLFNERIQNMITYKEALGYSRGSYEYYLYTFDNYCFHKRPTAFELTQDIVLDWAVMRQDESINSLNRRLAAIRELGRYLISIGEDAYVLPSKMTKSNIRYVPHLYTDTELSTFFNCTDCMESTQGDPLAQYITSVIFRMIYCCGLRPGEALRIRVEDIDLNTGRLYIRESKRHKDRTIVLHEDLLRICVRYNVLRSLYISNSDFFFSDIHGKAHNKQWLNRQFKKCWSASGITQFTPPRPRIYDFRHAFATRKIMEWIDKKEDLYARLPYLSAYMGHSDFRFTAYYIHLIPERLQDSCGIDWTSYEAFLPEVRI